MVSFVVARAQSGLSFWPCRRSRAFISFHFSLLGFMSFHFSLVGLHFRSFWIFGLSFPFLLASWAYNALHFGLVGLHFLAFWPFGPSFTCIFALSQFPCILALWSALILLIFAFWALISFRHAHASFGCFPGMRGSHGPPATPRPGRAAPKKSAYLWRRAPPRPPGQPPSQQA